MASTSSEAPPPSSACETPTINNSTIAKSKYCSIRNSVANFTAKFFVSKPKPLGNNHHNAASSSTATTIKNDDHGGAALSLSSKIRDDFLLVDSAFEEAKKKYMDHGGALFLSSNMIRNNLLLVDYSAAFAEAKKYMDHLNVKINKAHKKFNELQALGGSLRDFDELRKDVAKLRLQISSHVKIRSADSNPYRKRWPNINEAEDGMSHFFYKEPEVTNSGDSDGLLKAFYDLRHPLQHCLLCFFKFPPAVTIKRTTMICLWIGQGYISRHLQISGEYLTREKEELPIEEEAGNKIFDQLIAKGFIEPIYQKVSLVPDSGMMRLSVRHSLYKEAEVRGFSSNDSLDLDLGFVCGGRDGDSCLVNVGEAIINYEPAIFENMKDIRSLYLGRWQNSATHHIELANAKNLRGLKKLNSLTFLSLRGISMITELPTAILELKLLQILDFHACHNLEVIPDNIGLLKSLTQLDMSECYFLEHMPKSLAQLSNLEVLKGFFIGDVDNIRSCTLRDLLSLSKLRKLSIYTSVEDFPRAWEGVDLPKFEGLKKLTISWGGCSIRTIGAHTEEEIPKKKFVEEDNLESGEGKKKLEREQMRRKIRAHAQAIRAAYLFKSVGLPPRLQKLDLQCFPMTSIPLWLEQSNLKELKKLYIRGGKLCELGQLQKCDLWKQCTVEILHLKYLSELEIDWRELRDLFPKLIYLHQVECPKLTNFWCDERGVWINKEAVDTHVQLQKYLRTSVMIGSNSMSGSGPTIDQDDCNIFPLDEKQL